MSLIRCMARTFSSSFTHQKLSLYSNSLAELRRSVAFAEEAFRKASIERFCSREMFSRKSRYRDLICTTARRRDIGNDNLVC
ncbi:unnamed protein product [Phytomonas sp. EM1]|nr:unnamed protein product [Phytomonas sp. EM1]|eukprot:CCW63768.1 unnamed protein product [Phytomonas sp. isolate EM1]